MQSQVFSRTSSPTGDKVGVILRGRKSRGDSAASVHFTLNGKEFGNPINVSIPRGGFFPIIGLQYPGEEVLFKMGRIDCGTLL